MAYWIENVGLAKSQGCSTATVGQAGQAEYGLGSVIRDLDKEVSTACELAYNLNGILGVSTPPSGENPAVSSEGHFGTIRDALSRLRYANQNLSRAIQHLNS